MKRFYKRLTIDEKQRIPVLYERGLSCKQIAVELGVSYKTVINYISQSSLTRWSNEEIELLKNNKDLPYVDIVKLFNGRKTYAQVRYVGDKLGLKEKRPKGKQLTIRELETLRDDHKTLSYSQLCAKYGITIGQLRHYVHKYKFKQNNTLT